MIQLLVFGMLRGSVMVLLEPHCLLSLLTLRRLQIVQVPLIKKNFSHRAFLSGYYPIHFFFSFIANISLLSWSLHLFTFPLRLSSLKYGFYVNHVPK